MTEDEEYEALEQRLNMKEQEYEQINHPNGVTTWKTKPKEQPKALRLAEIFEQTNQMQPNADIESKETAAELRRLHALNQELLEALKYWAVRDPHNKQTRAAIAKAQGASNE